MRRLGTWFAGTLATVDPGGVAGGYCVLGYRSKVTRPRKASQYKHGCSIAGPASICCC